MNNVHEQEGGSTAAPDTPASLLYRVRTVRRIYGLPPLPPSSFSKLEGSDVGRMEAMIAMCGPYFAGLGGQGASI